jgi:hypothetical protein
VDRPQDRHLIPGANRNGRPKGSRDKRTIEIQIMARSLIEDPAYQASLKKRLEAGKAPHMEPILYYYAYGKPIDRVRLAGEDGGPVQVSDPFFVSLMKVWQGADLEQDAHGGTSEAP